jgi:hypothetical protein
MPRISKRNLILIPLALVFVILVVVLPVTLTNRGNKSATISKAVEEAQLILSDPPSGMPSDTPSTAPSDFPSSMPSDTPSSVPSDAPSLTPFSWGTLLTNVRHGTC